jgi:hypothetical protein
MPCFIAASHAGRQDANASLYRYARKQKEIRAEKSGWPIQVLQLGPTTPGRRI